MNDNMSKNFMTPKLSSLAIIGMLLSVGTALVKGENNYSLCFIIGLIFLSIGGILAFSIFFIYIKDEHYEKIIKQLEKANKTLERNFMSARNINRQIENSNRETMGRITGGYSQKKKDKTFEKV